MAARAVFGKPAAGESSGGCSGSSAAEGRKLDLSEVQSIQRSITEERNKLRLFVIKAKQDYEERKERIRQGGGPDATQIAGETDKDEYYSASVGEVFGPERRYRTEAAIGRGVFSSVFHCKDTTSGREYAVKFIRSNTMMRRAAEKEVEMYRRLARDARREDPEGARHLINLSGCQTLEHAGHLCFVFELLRCDMRFALQKYGQGAGLPLASLAQYAKQLFAGLRALRRLKVIHADLKPDNLLMTMNKAEIQICDFGSAMDFAETVRTSYAQPRYYRAPEIMLGLHYDSQIDVWSAGTTVFELATGKILFTGKTNNAMLKQMIDVRGGFTKRMTTDGEFSRKHFTPDGEFIHRDSESMTGEPQVIPARVARPPRPVLGLLQAALPAPGAGLSQAAHDRWVSQLAELVGRCLCPDPVHRAEPAQVLELGFFAKRQ